MTRSPSMRRRGLPATGDAVRKLPRQSSVGSCPYGASSPRRPGDHEFREGTAPDRSIARSLPLHRRRAGDESVRPGYPPALKRCPLPLHEPIPHRHQVRQGSGAAEKDVAPIEKVQVAQAIREVAGGALKGNYCRISTRGHAGAPPGAPPAVQSTTPQAVSSRRHSGQSTEVFRRGGRTRAYPLVMERVL